jgi:hypothetical protein
MSLFVTENNCLHEVHAEILELKNIVLALSTSRVILTLAAVKISL